YPFELFAATEKELRNLFAGDARALVANVLWQTVRWRRQGKPVSYGTTTRGYFYRPIMPLLGRAGHAAPGVLSALVVRDGQYDTKGMYNLFLLVLGHLIGEYAIFTYTDLGIHTVHQEGRGVGKAHADVIVLCEKVSLAPFVKRLAQRFEISYVVMDGSP